MKNEQQVNNQMQAPQVAPPPTSMVMPPAMPKKSKTGLIVALVVGVLLLLGVGGGALAYTVYQQPENVLLDAMTKLQTADKVATHTEVTSDFSYSSNGTSLAFKKLTFDINAEASPSIDTNAEILVTFNGQDITLKASVIANEDGELYFKVENLTDTIEKTLGKMVDLPSSALAEIDKIDGKWAKYSIDDWRESNKEYADTAQCVLDVYKEDFKDSEKRSEIVEIYRQHQFVEIDDDVQSKDGNLGYVVSINKSEINKFSAAAKETSFGEKIADCGDEVKSITSEIGSSAVQDSDSNETEVKTTIWVSQWSHELKAVDVDVEYDGEPTEYTVNSHTDFDFTKGVEAAEPTDARSAEDWVKHIYDAYSGAASSTTE